VAGTRVIAPRMQIGVRLSAFDLVSFRPDPDKTSTRKMGPGIPDSYEHPVPYLFGFGVDANNPERYDLTEPRRFLSLLQELDIKLVNLTAGSPYYNPH